MPIRRYLGIARSLGLYYGVPFRLAGMRRLYAGLVPEGGLCFDIGAHVGNRLRCFRSMGARVVALEPQPDFARILRLLYGRDRGDGATFHTLRHTFASWLVQKDVQLMKVAKLMGDNTEVVEKTYAHLMPKDLRRAVNLLGRK